MDHLTGLVVKVSASGAKDLNSLSVCVDHLTGLVVKVSASGAKDLNSLFVCGPPHWPSG